MRPADDLAGADLEIDIAQDLIILRRGG